MYKTGNIDLLHSLRQNILSEVGRRRRPAFAEVPAVVPTAISSSNPVKRPRADCLRVSSAHGLIVIFFITGGGTGRLRLPSSPNSVRVVARASTTSIPAVTLPKIV